MFLKFSKGRIIAGSIISAILIAFTCIFSETFFLEKTKSGILLFVLTLLCCLIIGFIISAKSVMKEKLKNLIRIAVILLLPIVSMTMVECLNSVFIYNFYYVDFFNSYILYLLFYGLIFAFTGSFRLSTMIINPVFYVFGLANYYINAFKGSPFQPMDFLSIETAEEVMGSYNYTPNYQIVIATVLLVGIMCIGLKLNTPKMHITTKIISRVACFIAAAAVSLIFFFTDTFANNGLDPDFWNQTRGYHRSGFVLNFCLNTKYLYLKVPEDYDYSQTDALIEELYNEENAKDSKDKPDIICIMNESLSDLSVCGNFKTNKEYMPYYNSLKKNTVKGNLYVPVHGSGTSNTEYEFLTGNATAFYPAGSNAYTLYVKEHTSSLVSTLGAAGYSTNAFHPYYASGWNRKYVYNSFGFRDYLSITSVIKPALLLDYINAGCKDEDLIKLCNEEYPNENVLQRAYVSDECNYKKVISLYEERDTSKPYFLFNVTMQNHGSYSKTFSNFKNSINITSTSYTYPKAEQYLSLIKKSDEALKILIDYFKKADRKVVICIFGDHQPAIETAFYEEIMNTDNIDNLSYYQKQKMYITPFMIWTNYDIKEENIKALSANYLSSYVLKIANVNNTKYGNYLYNLSKIVPVVSPTGVIDSNGVYTKDYKKSKYSELLKKYNKIQYNNAIDEDNEQTYNFYN